MFLVSLSWSQDTLKTLRLTDFLQHIKENHPVALIASNDVLRAEQVVRLSKGNFDPVAIGGIDQKYYDGSTYYSILSSGIKIPTRIGWNLKVMGDWNSGSFLNPENRVPTEGLTYLGIDVPLGRGMFTDAQRTQLKRAAVAFDQSNIQKQLALNDLLYEAGQYFIIWQEQEAQLALAQEVFLLAKTRLEQVKINAALGERPEMDTLEASAVLILRELEVNEKMLSVKNVRLQIENYIWEKGTLPLLLDPIISAEKLQISKPSSLAIPENLTLHPILTLYNLKISDLELERKLKIEQLKPQFNVNYNLLQTPQNLFSTQFSFTNYKWGATFSMPILLRKERSSLSITRLYLENTHLEMDKKQRDLATKQLQIRNEWNNNVLQSQTSSTMAERYLSLAAAERQLFEGGESSLFIVNAREINYISAKMKYIEYLAKTQKSALSEKYITGILGM
jgi:hypothetical protein